MKKKIFTDKNNLRRRSVSIPGYHLRLIMYLEILPKLPTLFYGKLKNWRRSIYLKRFQRRRARSLLVKFHKVRRINKYILRKNRSSKIKSFFFKKKTKKRKIYNSSNKSFEKKE